MFCYGLGAGGVAKMAKLTLMAARVGATYWTFAFRVHMRRPACPLWLSILPARPRPLRSPRLYALPADPTNSTHGFKNKLYEGCSLGKILHMSFTNVLLYLDCFHKWALMHYKCCLCSSLCSVFCLVRLSLLVASQIAGAVLTLSSKGKCFAWHFDKMYWFYHVSLTLAFQKYRVSQRR